MSINSNRRPRWSVGRPSTSVYWINILYTGNCCISEAIVAANNTLLMSPISSHLPNNRWCIVSTNSHRQPHCSIVRASTTEPLSQHGVFKTLVAADNNKLSIVSVSSYLYRHQTICVFPELTIASTFCVSCDGEYRTKGRYWCQQQMFDGARRYPAIDY